MFSISLPSMTTAFVPDDDKMAATTEARGSWVLMKTKALCLDTGTTVLDMLASLFEQQR